MNQLSPYRNIHLVGIGGAGMSAIARILLDRGFAVSGSDNAENATTQRLRELGARIFKGHAAENVAATDLVVVSTAIKADNPERCAAEAASIPIWHRAQVLAEIMRGGRSVAVSGTHGKTTTTSMLGMMLISAGFDPTVLIGGEVNDIGGNARPGQGEWVVAEADESDASFLEMDPDRIIITNIEADHLDFYTDHQQIIDTFRTFTGRLRPGGRVIACLDDPVLAMMVEQQAWPVITYGLDRSDADLTAVDIEPHDGGRGTRFTPVWRGRRLEPVELIVPGRHNVLDALAAMACALDLNADEAALGSALAVFDGAKRRFQVKGCVAGITIVDDYAHHPTEIAATLQAARAQVEARGKGRVVCLFQPHRYSRTKALAEDFGRALATADLALVTDVYSAGEARIEGVSGRLVLEAIETQGNDKALYFETLEDSRTWLAEQLDEHDLFLTMGAGNVWTVGEGLLDDLRPREKIVLGR